MLLGLLIGITNLFYRSLAGYIWGLPDQSAQIPPNVARGRAQGFDLDSLGRLSVSGIPPFVKGGEGGFSQGVPKQIPLFPPFSKGDLTAIDYSRISS